jgi:hypothetical protein
LVCSTSKKKFNIITKNKRNAKAQQDPLKEKKAVSLFFVCACLLAASDFYM